MKKLKRLKENAREDGVVSSGQARNLVRLQDLSVPCSWMEGCIRVIA